MLKEKINEVRLVAGDNQKEIKKWLLILVLCTMSFALGYLTNREFSHTPIIIEKCSGNPTLLVQD